MNHCSALAPAEHCRRWTVWEVSCQADATSQSLPICSQKTATGKMLHITSKYWKQGRKRDISASTPLTTTLWHLPAHGWCLWGDVPAGWCAGGRWDVAACLGGGPSSLLTWDPDTWKQSQGPLCTAQGESIRTAPKSVQVWSPRQRLRAAAQDNSQEGSRPGLIL